MDIQVAIYRFGSNAAYYMLFGTQQVINSLVAMATYCMFVLLSIRYALPRGGYQHIVCRSPLCLWGVPSCEVLVNIDSNHEL